MSDFTLYFDCEPTADADSLKEELEAGLRQFSSVASTKLSETTARFTGLELLAGITLTASIIHQGASIVHDVRTIIEDLRVIFKQASVLTQKLAVKKVSVSVGMKPKWIDKLTDDDYEIIAQNIIKARQANTTST